MLGSGGRVGLGSEGCVVGKVGKVGCGSAGIEGIGGNVGLGKFATEGKGGNCRRRRAASPPGKEKAMRRAKTKQLKIAILVLNLRPANKQTKKSGGERKGIGAKKVELLARLAMWAVAVLVQRR
ncbi:hypothetical protein POTOM_027523 [Populus tomentosa]|uniref:Uncharacterized protein n=1 Tax=Populus tomentosa TaxID=118781 RepID=A0A8X7ZFW4_POPTO|nr:hypothetical protein POTOM_027523 [Populus tomentosa]